MRGSYTTKTPQLAKMDRATNYTLARALKTVRFRDSKPASTTGIYDVLGTVTMHAESDLVYVKGLTFSNAI